MSFNSFFSKFGNNSNAGMKIYDNQVVENAQAISAEEFVLPDKSENTFESSDESLETEYPDSFNDSLEVSPNEASETIQTVSTEQFIPFDKSPCIDESDPDELLELDDLFAFD